VEARGIIGPVEEVFYIKQGLPGEGECQVGGAGFVFMPKFAFFLGGNTARIFKGAFFTFHNYLLIRQLRLKGSKWAGAY
jgi:hypothetical protein